MVSCYQQLINIFLKLTIVLVITMAMMGMLHGFFFAPIYVALVLLLLIPFLWKGLVQLRLTVQLRQ